MKHKKQLNEGIAFLKASPYCLWIGAGIPIHLAGKSEVKPLAWKSLINQLAKEAKIETDKIWESLSFTQQLEQIKIELNSIQFNRRLRELIHHALAKALYWQMDQCIEGNPYADPEKLLVPKAFKQVATLGVKANPIVNFNIETISSVCIVAASSPYAIKPFNPSSFGQASYRGGSTQETLEKTTFLRHVYHPHGILEITGKPIITENDYQYLDGSLALELATHATFHTHLAIVGMSLNDNYLRIQLAKFRKQISDIYWFSTTEDSSSEEINKWALINRINIVEINNWSDFWEEVENTLPTPTSEKLITTLYRSITMNIDNHLRATILNGSPYKDLPEGYPNHIEWLNRGIYTGERHSDNNRQRSNNKYFDYLSKCLKNLESLKTTKPVSSPN